MLTAADLLPFCLSPENGHSFAENSLSIDLAEDMQDAILKAEPLDKIEALTKIKKRYTFALENRPLKWLIDIESSNVLLARGNRREALGNLLIVQDSLAKTRKLDPLTLRLRAITKTAIEAFKKPSKPPSRPPTIPLCRSKTSTSLLIFNDDP